MVEIQQNTHIFRITKSRTLKLFEAITMKKDYSITINVVSTHQRRSKILLVPGGRRNCRTFRKINAPPFFIPSFPVETNFAETSLGFEKNATYLSRLNTVVRSSPTPFNHLIFGSRVVRLWDRIIKGEREGAKEEEDRCKRENGGQRGESRTRRRERGRRKKAAKIDI